MKFLDSIIQFFKDEINNRSSLTPINKDVLIESIQENIKSLNSIASVIKDIGVIGGLLDSYNALKFNKDNKSNINHDVLNIPSIYRSSLNNRAKQLEDARFLHSIDFTCNILLDVNKRMLKDIDRVIIDKSIIINKIRITDVYCLSLIRQSDFYVNYCNNLIGLISSVTNNISHNFPKYRQTYLIKHFDLFISITDRICESPNSVFSLRDIKNVKDSGMNFNVSDGGALSGVATSFLSREMTLGIAGFILFPNPFRYFAELYVDHKHSVYQKNKETKEWLEYHVALLKMKQNNLDENSEQYLITLKAIAVYEDKISKKQAEIDRYLKE